MKRADRLPSMIAVTGQAVLGLSLLLVLAAAFWPIQDDAAGSNALDAPRPAEVGLGSEPMDALDSQSLLLKMAGRRLIRPAQIQAAVKDTGAAQRLLSKLKLQGVVQMGGDHVAYIQVADRGVQTVRVGSSVLDFMVEAVESGRVKLSLDGVEVELTH